MAPGSSMAPSIVELREQAKLLEAELARQVASGDASETRAGVVVGFAGLLVGLMIQVKHPNTALHVAVGAALVAAIAALAATIPRRFRLPDPEAMADLYEQLPEAQATSILVRARIRAIGRNYSITESKRILLSLSVTLLVVAIVLSAASILKAGA